MKLATAHLKSTSPYSQSRYYNDVQVPKLQKELAADYEVRTWRNRCNTRADGHIIISPLAFANSLKEAAKYLSIPIPGKARMTFTKHFEAGVRVLEPLVLPEMKDTVEGEWLFVPSDGKRGGGTRVPKCFPLIPAWAGVVSYWVVDDIITQDAFAQALEASGKLIGIGRFRPRNMGYYGTFECVKLDWDADK